MPPKSSQVRLPFDKLTEEKLKPILKKFAKWGCNIVKVDAPNKAKRESGYLIKNFTMFFEDGQQMLVRVKADGTVFQIKLNNRVMPIHNVDNMDKAVKEMVAYVQDNAKAYAKAKIQRQKRKLKPKPPPVATTRAEKLAEAKNELAQVTESITNLENQINAVEVELASKKKALAQAQNALAYETERNNTLKAEYESLAA